MRQKGEKSPAEEALDAVTINPLALDEEFTRIASRMATFNERYVRALRAHLRSKAETERVYAVTYIAVREELNEGGKVTEAMIKTHVEAHADYTQARLAAIDAEVEKVRLWGVLDALRAKRDALISLGANMRAEMQGSPSIRGERRAAREFDSPAEDDDALEIDIED